MLNLAMTNAQTVEFRAYGGTVYGSVNVDIVRTDTGDTVSTDARPAQLDLERYPEIKQRVDELMVLVANAYLFEAKVAPDPQQPYTPPEPEPAPTEPEPTPPPDPAP